MNRSMYGRPTNSTARTSNANHTPRVTRSGTYSSLDDPHSHVHVQECGMISLFPMETMPKGDTTGRQHLMPLCPQAQAPRAHLGLQRERRRSRWCGRGRSSRTPLFDEDAVNGHCPRCGLPARACTKPRLLATMLRRLCALSSGHKVSARSLPSFLAISVFRWRRCFLPARRSSDNLIVSA
jgi:hypothetical protein